MRARLAAVLVALAGATAAHGSSLERFEAFVQATRSARAEFEQKVYDRSRKLVQSSRGTLAFQRPGRFRWSYAPPHEQLIVGDGERVWIYDAGLNQVTVQRQARALGATPAALLSGAAGIDQAFELRDAGSRDGLEWLEARPRGGEAGFERIRLGLGIAGVEAMELTDTFGQTTELRFRNLERNPALDLDTFRFTPPAGADVLGRP